MEMKSSRSPLRALRGALGGRKGQRGFALIVVLSLTVVIIFVIKEILFQTDLEARASVGERNRLNAEVSAQGGAQIANMLFALDAQVPDDFREIIKTKLGGREFYNLLDNFELGGEALGANGVMEKAGLNALLDGALVEGLKAIPGKFILSTNDESAKINVNMAGAQNLSKSTFEALRRMFSTPHERSFLEEKGLSPERLAANVVDYIDQNSIDDSVDKGQSEETYYDQQRLSYKPKNAPLDSLEELRRIPGFNDDEVYNLFSPYLTVWPQVIKPSEKYFNVNAASADLMAALFTDAGQGVNDDAMDRFEDDRAKNPWLDTKDFNEACAKLQNKQMCEDFIRSISRTTSTIFKVEITGFANGISRRLVYVFDRGIPAEAKDAKPQGGAAAALQGRKIQILYQRFQ